MEFFRSGGFGEKHIPLPLLWEFRDEKNPACWWLRKNNGKQELYDM
jgi:hypothetical protein